MRTSGVTDVVVGLSPNDHLRWSFDGFADLPADGTQLGQRACHVARCDHLATHPAEEPATTRAAMRDGFT
ncbi:hypothetical protein [Lentzea nigeriaca]|uniref:hypothetical protein n=1 Tax=Lentzea nigeriaca TaxID=1128665 RepID=UPI00195C7CA3|nr:hypothetical protein [Lentzea nigeriaca]MBM7858937.1 hypothetical protein [Lentzea nigeriaca]